MNELLRVALEISALPQKGRPDVRETYVLIYPEGPDGPEVELTVRGYVNVTPAAPYSGFDYELVVTEILQPDGTPWPGELSKEQEQMVSEDLLQTE